MFANSSTHYYLLLKSGFGQARMNSEARQNSAARIIQRAYKRHRFRVSIFPEILRLIRHQNVSNEILETEKVYLSALSACIKVSAVIFSNLYLFLLR